MATATPITSVVISDRFMKNNQPFCAADAG
jgi:hypothetical protein